MSNIVHTKIDQILNNVFCISVPRDCESVFHSAID